MLITRLAPAVFAILTVVGQPAPAHGDNNSGETATVRHAPDGVEITDCTVYDDQCLKMKMPPEWFTCKESSDCSIAKIPCGDSLAVNDLHWNETISQLCTAEGDYNCAGPCRAIMPDNPYPICENGWCVAKQQPPSWNPHHG
jgi:hypothetical protein